ncbi:hypothetical protein [Actinoplanes couchii]|uniref:Integral membrane protein n=1 Tax=Actinoplanes couchii TaxID=403638 RepID=A0ABQ3X132_9ACTN|nr:hypothetical protein [Actinoplanes couchii]MDR6316614.1 hypothetical protein [Actinoplanes couchii]GID52228.1 hypothetical protein Aco03nite_006320 [Actinoplanes couchii]
MTAVEHAAPVRARVLPARLAALTGVAGIAVHLILAGSHAGHAPAILAALGALALVCVPCGVSLWRSPGDRASWLTMLALSGIMMLLHLGMNPQGPMLAVVLAVPAVQAVLGAVAFLQRYGYR